MKYWLITYSHRRKGDDSTHFYYEATTNIFKTIKELKEDTKGEYVLINQLEVTKEEYDYAKDYLT